MKHTRVQRRRSSKRKGTRKHRKQQGGQPRPGSYCQDATNCYYGGYHDFSDPYPVPIGGGRVAVARTCHKCNCQIQYVRYA